MVYTNLEKIERREKYMKKFLIWIVILILVIGVVSACFLFYVNANSKGRSTTNLKPKVTEEVRYLESNLILLLNSLNNISYESYRVQTEEIEPSKERFSEKVGVAKEAQIVKGNLVVKKMEVGKIIKGMIVHKNKARLWQTTF